MLSLFIKPDEYLDLTVLVPEAQWDRLIPESRKDLVCFLFFFFLFFFFFSFCDSDFQLLISF